MSKDKSTPTYVDPKPFAAEGFISLPAEVVLAASACASKDQSRPQIAGVHVVKSGEDTVRVMGTDGHVLFVSNVAVGGPLPEWCEHGRTISNEHLPNVVKMIGKLNGNGLVQVSGSLPRRVVLTDGIVSEFRLEWVEATYPDVQRIIDGCAEAFAGGESEHGVGASFNPELVRRATDLAKILTPDKDSRSLTLYQSQKNFDAPSVFTFAREACFLVVMPLRNRRELRPNDVKALGSKSQTMVIAGLKAQRTRNVNLLANAFDEEEERSLREKIDDLDRRIAVASGHDPSRQISGPAPKPSEAAPKTAPADAKAGQVEGKSSDKGAAPAAPDKPRPAHDPRGTVAKSGGDDGKSSDPKVVAYAPKQTAEAQKAKPDAPKPEAAKSKSAGAPPVRPGPAAAKPKNPVADAAAPAKSKDKSTVH